MDVLSAVRAILLYVSLLFSMGCQIGYYLHSAYHQSVLINSRESLDKVLRGSSLTEEQKRKLRLVQETKKFAEEDLGLKASRNYTTYVQIEDPYVTYIVQVAHFEQLKPHLWKFPFVGEVPYKGYFKKTLAEEEASKFPKDKYDTYIRGVSAYSTLGWFQDSVISSMLRYDDHDLVEVIIHETIHTTLFIKDAAEFNERMANFLGREGMKLFYQKREGPNSSALIRAENESHDQKLFSDFLTREIDALKKWYSDNQGAVTVEKKSARLKELQMRFTNELKPQLKDQRYSDFEKRELNNAFLLSYQTYEYNLENFQKLYDYFKGDFKSTLTFLKTLQKSATPDQALKNFVSSGIK